MTMLACCLVEHQQGLFEAVCSAWSLYVSNEDVVMTHDHRQAAFVCCRQVASTTRYIQAAIADLPS